MATPRKKLKPKDAKSEIHGMVELVVRAIIAEKGLQTKKAMDLAITKAISEMKAQMQSLELKVTNIDTALQNMRGQLDESIQNVHKDCARLYQVSEENPKRCLAVINKVGKKQRDDIEAIRAESQKKIDSLETSISGLSKELASLSESLNQFKHSQSGEINERINVLEESIDLGNLPGLFDQSAAPLSPQSRGKLQVNQFQNQRKARPVPAAVGAAIHATFNRLNSHDADIEAIKEKLRTTRVAESQEDDIKVLRRKLRAVVDTTSAACHTVTTSVADVQDATVQIYSWAERVHAAMGILSEKVGVRPNVCPRLQILPNGFESDGTRIHHSPLRNYAGNVINDHSPIKHHHQRHHHHHHHVNSASTR